jgi:hypothetical protein
MTAVGIFRLALLSNSFKGVSFVGAREEESVPWRRIGLKTQAFFDR